MDNQMFQVAMFLAVVIVGIIGNLFKDRLSKMENKIEGLEAENKNNKETSNTRFEEVNKHISEIKDAIIDKIHQLELMLKSK